MIQNDRHSINGHRLITSIDGIGLFPRICTNTVFTINGE